MFREWTEGSKGLPCLEEHAFREWEGRTPHLLSSGKRENEIIGTDKPSQLPPGFGLSNSRTLLAGFAHELKTPLAIVAGYVEVLLTGSLGPLTDRQERSLKDAAANCLRLKKFVQEFLSQAALASRQVVLHFEERNLNHCLTEVCGFWREHVLVRKMVLYLQIDPAIEPFLFDYDKIQQVVSNLLDNALKFTPSGGTIWLTAHRVRIESRGAEGESTASGGEPAPANLLPAVRVVVADTGPGIAAEFRTEVFREFFRIPNQGNFEGNGLGLAIAERLVQAHGGKIWVEGEPGAGTRVSFLVPVRHNHHAANEP
jgi:two-component system, cell cycle sensor histidine kinase PleC